MLMHVTTLVCGITLLLTAQRCCAAFVCERPDQRFFGRITSTKSHIDIADGATEHPPFQYDTNRAWFVLPKPLPARSSRIRRWTKPLRRWWKRRKYSETTDPSDGRTETAMLKFQYDYDQLLIGDGWATNGTTTEATAVLLVHPIGVGIGKWFYDRLMQSLVEETFDMSPPRNFVFVVPDLLGSSSGCNPTNEGTGDSWSDHLPLLNITDWTDQVLDLMDQVETDFPASTIANWCIVANGGCAPIALRAAQKSQKNVTNLVLSSVPRLPFFLESSDPAKVAKSYRTLCGLAGRLFWWYTCRNGGAFIQKFSERNLVEDAANLGDSWRPNCYRDATRDGGRSRYSTFAFLAGALQDGCQESLAALIKRKGQVQINFIRGRDVRRNQARSWFWQKRKRQRANAKKEATKRETIRDYVEKNGIGGAETLIGGRVSLAHEDAAGYAAGLLSFLK